MKSLIYIWLVIQAGLPSASSLYLKWWSTTITALALLFLFISISTETVKAQDLPRESKINFKYKGKFSEHLSSSDTLPIDINAIYYSIFVDPVFQDTIYDYLRFFPKGQLFRSGNYPHEPSVTEAQQENLRLGYHGYYYIEDTLLHMEIYTDRYSDKEYFVATFNDSTINIYKTKTMRAPDILAATRKDTIIYQKKSVAFPDNVSPHW